MTVEPTEQAGGTQDAAAGAAVAASIRSTGGWAVPGAVLTVTDMTGRQVARAPAGDDGDATTGPLAAGTYTAILMAPGFVPAAQAVQGDLPDMIKAIAGDLPGL